MITLDHFLKEHLAKKGSILVRINEDIAVVWILNDYILRKNDICYLPEDLAELLIKRGTALEIDILRKVIKSD